MYLCHVIPIVACRMMQKRVIQIVMDSFGSQFYGKAMECLKVLREESVKVSVHGTKVGEF